MEERAEVVDFDKDELTELEIDVATTVMGWRWWTRPVVCRTRWLGPPDLLDHEMDAPSLHGLPVLCDERAMAELEAEPIMGVPRWADSADAARSVLNRVDELGLRSVFMLELFDLLDYRKEADPFRLVTASPAAICRAALAAVRKDERERQAKKSMLNGALIDAEVVWAGQEVETSHGR